VCLDEWKDEVAVTELCKGGKGVSLVVCKHEVFKVRLLRM
jgi:hypothetical protein